MIFFDRSVPKSVVDALKLVRDDEIVWLEDRFPSDASDSEWLTDAGREGWLVISRDKRIRYRPGEIALIRDGAAGCFILGQSKNPTRWEYLKLLARTLDTMEQRFAETERPFIYVLNSSGAMRRAL